MTAAVTPFAIAADLPHLAIQDKVTAAVNEMERAALEGVRQDIHTDFHRQKGQAVCRSAEDFGEEVFPDAETAEARRNLAFRLINYPLGSEGGPTSDTVKTAARRLGMPVDDRVHDATSMAAKRALTARIVMPYYRDAWVGRGLECPCLPFRSNEPLSGALATALARAGMPPLEEFTDPGRLADVTAALGREYRDLSASDCFWAAHWPLIRLFLPGFDQRLLHAARGAVDRGDPRGRRLLDYVEFARAILRAVRTSAAALGAGPVDSQAVVEGAAKRLRRRNGVRHTAASLTAFLHARRVRIDAALQGRVGAGWLVWHDPDFRPIAHEVLTA